MSEIVEFEKWLRKVCFQKPTDEAYDLAKDAWSESGAALRKELEAVKEDRDLWKLSEDQCNNQFIELEKELADEKAKVERLKKALTEISSKSLCACSSISGMGSGIPTKWIGCDIHWSDDPMEYCLTCIANQALKEIGE